MADTVQDLFRVAATGFVSEVEGVRHNNLHIGAMGAKVERVLYAFWTSICRAGLTPTSAILIIPGVA